MYSDDSWLESYFEDRNEAIYFTPPYVPYEDEVDEYDDSDESDNGHMPDSFGGDLDSDYSGSWQDSDNSDGLHSSDFVDV